MKENALINKRTRQAIAVMSFLFFGAIIIPFMFGLYPEPPYFKWILGIVNVPWLWFFTSREQEKRTAPADTTEMTATIYPKDFDKIDTSELTGGDAMKSSYGGPQNISPGYTP